MTKEELEIKISTLQNLVTQKNDELSQYANQIDTLKSQLEDINKPKLTSIGTNNSLLFQRFSVIVTH